MQDFVHQQYFWPNYDWLVVEPTHPSSISWKVRGKTVRCYPTWWLDQPIWRICSSKWVHLPPILGVKIPKYFELPPPRYYFTNLDFAETRVHFPLSAYPLKWGEVLWGHWKFDQNYDDSFRFQDPYFMAYDINPYKTVQLVNSLQKRHNHGFWSAAHIFIHSFI